MAQVIVTINGRQFRMACEDGQEQHLTRLAYDFDQRIVELRAKFGEIGDTRLTVMAALTIADQLFEAVSRIRKLEEELAAREDAKLTAADRDTGTDQTVIAALNSAAERIESLTSELNRSLGESAALG
jgi:cell division protein ZapA